MNNFGERLKTLRQKFGITQTQLAQKLEISSSAVGMYEQNRREPDSDTIIKLSSLFSVSTDYLLNGKDNSRDVNELLNTIKNEMKLSGGLMFNGVPMTEEDTEKFFDAISIAISVASNDIKKKDTDNNVWYYKKRSLQFNRKIRH